MSDLEYVKLNLLNETPAHRAPIQTTTPKPSENLSQGKPNNSVNDLADAVSLFKTVIDSQFASLSESSNYAADFAGFSSWVKKPY